MVQIGNTKLPGVQTTVESSASVGVNVGAPANVAIVGQADLSNGTATANSVESITTPVKARKKFGDESPVTQNCIDALSEGAYPVYAVGVEKTSVTGEDISGIGSTSGTLANSPGEEDADAYSFTVDLTSKSAVITYDNPANKNPGADEVYVNPVTGEFELDAAPSSSGDVDYEYHDYESAIDEIEASYADIVDFVGSLSENNTVTSYELSAVNRLETQYEFAVVIAGAESYIDDFTSVEAEADDSRLQEYYPARNSDGESIIGSILGKKASLGISASAMNKNLSSQNDLRVTLSRSEQENLVDARINPVSDVGAGSRLVDDMTAVTSGNTEESSFNQGISRLVTDFVTESVHEISQGYVGELNTQSARNSLRGDIVTVLKRLLGLQAITGFTVTVDEVDAMTASVDVGINTIDPLRNIVANITAGEVSGGIGE